MLSAVWDTDFTEGKGFCPCIPRLPCPKKSSPRSAHSAPPRETFSITKAEDFSRGDAECAEKFTSRTISVQKNW